AGVGGDRERDGPDRFSGRRSRPFLHRDTEHRAAAHRRRDQAPPLRLGGAPAARPAPPAPADTTLGPGRPEGSPPPGAPAKAPAAAPTEPRAGGRLTFVVPGEPPSYDAHREETYALIHPAAPHYNTLLRIDPLDPTGTRVVWDLATSWAVSAD